ncbi:MAG: tryptophan--tRNA ligase [Firmicutes bacterium]|jgi:tryptophanyl-tRNA synthetase|nr:tryptophan--tRNA ligase [Bacillota bacterium]
MAKRVFSGVQPSGSLTIGNYFGALRNFAKLQHEAECFFCVVNLHALTVPQDPKELYQRTLDVAKLFVACGIDPEKATIFVQSHVPAHSELSWLLECTTYVGELRRMTQYKDKASKREVVTSGLFTYPVLMAADILLYQTDEVPVGEDQKQHLELARDIAIRVNNRFEEEVFKVPEPYIPPKSAGGRIMSLQDPTEKMSKSAENPRGNIAILDPPDVIRKKIRSAVTDSGREIYYDEENKPAVSNLMVIYSLCSGKSLDEIRDQYADSGYGQFKKDLAELVVETLRPIQTRFEELSRPGVIQEVLAQGKNKAEPIALETLERFQKKLGLLPV